MTFQQTYNRILDRIADAAPKLTGIWWDGQFCTAYASSHLTPNGLALRRLTRRLSPAGRRNVFKSWKAGDRL